MNKTYLAIPALLIAGCANIDGQPVEDSVQVYKQTGSLQCEDDGLTIAELTQELNVAQVRVLDTACGTDGMMRMTVCGAPDGSIVAFDVPRTEASRAADAGFRLLATLPDARVNDCPTE